MVARPSGLSRFPAWLAPAAITGAVLLAYGNTFSAPFVFDDVPSIAENPAIRHLWPATGVGAHTTTAGRPLLELSFALNYAISGAAVWSYHALNLLIHLGAALLLLGIVRRTLASAEAAFCIALLWAVHPLQTEAVTYTVQRAESLMGLLYLLTLYASIRGAKTPARPWRWYSLAIAACAAGMATKEVMVSAPLLVLLWESTFRAGSFRAACRARRGLYLGLAATWLVLLVCVIAAGDRGGTAGFSAGLSVGRYALTQCAAILHYLRLCVWPYPLVFDYGTALAPLTWSLAGYVLVTGALLAGTSLALVRRHPAGLAGAWFFAILAPSSSVIPVATQTIAEHRLYLPLAAVIALGVAGAAAWLGPRATLAAGLVAALGLGLLTVDRNTLYRSELALWRATAADCPDNGDAHYNLGVLLLQQGQLEAAATEERAALRLLPDFAKAHSNLALILDKLGRTAEAAAEYRAALQLRPELFEAHTGLGNLLLHAGKFAEAAAEYSAAVALRPDAPPAHNNLGLALAQLRQSTEAVARFRTAVRLDPAYAEAWYNLANTEADTGQTRAAITAYRTAVRLRPDFPEAWFNLGTTLAAAGQTGEAVECFATALRWRPDFPAARRNLDLLRRRAP